MSRLATHLNGYNWTQTYRKYLIDSVGEDFLVDPSLLGTIWALLDEMIEQRIIVLKQDDYGIMIK